MFKRSGWIAILAAMLVLTLNSYAHAQDNTTVSGTIVDSDTLTWVNGTWSAVLNNPYPGTTPTYLDTGLPVVTSYNLFALDSSGHFSQALANNAAIFPVSTTWTFTFCPNASFRCSTLLPQTITGSTFNISALATAQITAPRIAALGANIFAYGTVEISTIPAPGASFFNTTTNVNCYWNQSAWICGSSGGNLASFNGATGPAITFNATSPLVLTPSGNTFTLTDTAVGLATLNGLAGPALTLTATSPLSVASSGTNINITTAAGGGNLVGTLTNTYVPKATGATTLGDSSIIDNGTTLSTTELFNQTIGNTTGTVPEANVLFYGADPTGVSDSTTAINNCLDATFATVLRTCYLPAGTYHVTNALTVGLYQTLRGDGWSSIIDVSVDYNASALGVIIPTSGFNPNSQATIKDLSIVFHHAPDTTTTTTAPSAATATTITVTSVPGNLAVGDYVIDVSAFTAIVPALGTSAAATTITNIAGNVLTLSNPVASPGVGSGDTINFNKPRASCSALGTATLTPGSGCTKYPWAIYNAGNGASFFHVNHVLISGAWDGWYQRGDASFLSDVNVGALDIGLDIDASQESGQFDSYRFWNFGFGEGTGAQDVLTHALAGIYFDNSTVAANLGRDDGVHISSIESFGGKINFTANWTYGQIANMNADGAQADVTFNQSSGHFTNIANFYRIGGNLTESPIQVLGGDWRFSKLWAQYSIAGATNPMISVTGGKFHVYGGNLNINSGEQAAVVSGAGSLMELDNMTFVYFSSCGTITNGLIQAQTGAFVNLQHDTFATGCTQPGINIATDDVQQSVNDVILQGWTFTPPGTTGHYRTINTAGTDFYNTTTFHQPLALATGSTAITQAVGDTSTKIATDQFVYAAGNRTASGFCTGVATSSTTLRPFGLGSSTATCTSVGSAGEGIFTTTAGTVSNLTMRCNVSGVNTSSGVFTLLDQPLGSGTASTTALTGTFGTHAANQQVVAAGTFAYAAGDILEVQFTTQLSETLAGCIFSFNY